MTANCGDQTSSKLDERILRALFADAVKRSGTFGAQLSIIKGQERLDFAAGSAHAKLNIPMTPDTLMKIGSVSKVFNAAILFSLMEDSRLDLDAPVLEYLPDFEVADPEATRTVTLRQLISMSSGLDNGPYDDFGSGDDALDRYVASLKSLPQHFTPGKYYGYSNAGTCVAGLVASRVTGKPWERLLRERILQPAGLTRVAALEADVLYQTVSAGHDLLPDGRVDITDPIISMSRCKAPSGDSLASCAGDLARFGMTFVRKGCAEGGARIMTESSIERMLTAQIGVPIGVPSTSYCLGCSTGFWNGVRIFCHAGATLTSSAFLFWIPAQQSSIAFMVNTKAAMGAFSEVVFQEIFSAAFGFRKPSADIAHASPDPIDLDRYVGIYQQLGATTIVKRIEHDKLSVRYIPHTKAYGVEREVGLSPRGKDRFSFDQPFGADVRGMTLETSFFGNDKNGRAMNMLNLGFPMRRID